MGLKPIPKNIKYYLCFKRSDLYNKEDLLEHEALVTIITLKPFVFLVTFDVTIHVVSSEFLSAILAWQELINRRIN